MGKLVLVSLALSLVTQCRGVASSIVCFGAGNPVFVRSLVVQDRSPSNRATSAVLSFLFDEPPAACFFILFGRIVLLSDSVFSSALVAEGRSLLCSVGLSDLLRVSRERNSGL